MIVVQAPMRVPARCRHSGTVIDGCGLLKKHGFSHRLELSSGLNARSLTDGQDFVNPLENKALSRRVLRPNASGR